MDQNTKYFHAIASVNRKVNKITRMAIDGITFETIDGLRSRIMYHKSFYQEDLPSITLPHDAFEKFDPISIEHLDSVPNGEEFKAVVWSCGPDKTSCFDGFNIRFIKQIWHTIASDIIHFVKNFFIYSEFPPPSTQHGSP